MIPNNTIANMYDANSNPIALESIIYKIRTYGSWLSVPKPSAANACTDAQTPLALVTNVAWIARAPDINPKAGEILIDFEES